MPTDLLTLQREQVVVINGPAMVEAKTEGVSVLGTTLKSGERILVRKNRILPFEAEGSEAKVQITCGEGGGYQVSCRGVGTKIWKGLEERVLSQRSEGSRKILILGENDSGKSTLSTFFVNKALNRGLKVGVVDGDVGQGDLAPPGCVGAALIKQRVFDLRDIRADFFGFVGATSPFGLDREVVEEVKRVGSMLESCAPDFCIVNTDGFVHGEGVDYKIRLIGVMEPDLVVCIKNVEGEEMLYMKVKEACSRLPVLLAERPEGIFKNPAQRAERRLSQYRRFLRDARRISFNLKGLRLRFSGSIYERNRELGHGERLVKKGEDGRVLMIRSAPEECVEIYQDEKKTIFTTNSLKGMFIGLGFGEKLSDFGVISELYSDTTVTVLTPYRNPFDMLYLSTIKLSGQISKEYLLQILHK